MIKEWAVIVAICSFIGFLSPLYWAFDLFNHFRVHAVLASVFLLILSLFYCRKMIAFITAMLVFNVHLVSYGIYQSDPVPPLEQSKTVRVVSANVLTNNKNYQAFISLIDQEDPDIVVVTEINDSWVEGLSPLITKYKFRYLHPQSDNFGLGIYSKSSFDARIVETGDVYDADMLVADFGEFDVIVAHPLPPISASYARDNRIYLEKLAEMVRVGDKPVIVAGDLNSTLWSQTMKPLFDAGLKSTNRAGLAYTWPAGAFPLALQIDHILTKNIPSGDFKVLTDIGSDHYPVRADLSF